MKRNLVAYGEKLERGRENNFREGEREEKKKKPTVYEGLADT